MGFVVGELMIVTPARPATPASADAEYHASVHAQIDDLLTGAPAPADDDHSVNVEAQVSAYEDTQTGDAGATQTVTYGVQVHATLLVDGDDPGDGGGPCVASRTGCGGGDDRPGSGLPGLPGGSDCDDRDSTGLFGSAVFQTGAGEAVRCVLNTAQLTVDELSPVGGLPGGDNGGGNSPGTNPGGSPIASPGGQNPGATIGDPATLVHPATATSGSDAPNNGVGSLAEQAAPAPANEIGPGFCHLPKTGAALVLEVLIGLALMTAGTALLLVRRRHQQLPV